MAKNGRWNNVVELLLRTLLDKVRVEDTVVALEGLRQEFYDFLVDY